MRARATFAAVAFGWAALGVAPPPGALRGFSVAAGLRERVVETEFVDIPSAQEARQVAAEIGARPHFAGTPGDYALAVSMRDRLRAAGVHADLETLRARVDTPRTLALTLLPASSAPRSGRAHAPTTVTLALAETAAAEDRSASAAEVSLPFNAGSADGDVRAPLVYADRGLEPDYATLAQANVDVRGAVVLLRYGAEFRGALAERAQTHGAVGVIFYSDPKDDGAARGPVYPDGPWRPPTAVQRGSVGDRVRIPTLPISAANAALLLDALRGSPGPPTWGGALPVGYPLARGPASVHLVVKLNRRLTTLWNTIGVIPGADAEHSVVLGAHRDAWVYGVGDNGAGLVTVLEVARGLGFLQRGGWRPQRTIVIAGWDGEEIGLAGSRAYVLAHHTALERGCVAYLNADENVSGQQVGSDGVAALAPTIFAVTHAVSDPTTPATSIYDRWAAQTPRDPPRVEQPSGGSDHAAFLFGLGVPVANVNFSGPFGVYHSRDDTLDYATRWSDPQFNFHRSAAQLYGLLTLRLADADVVPYRFGGYVPLLRNGFAQIAARAQREGLAVDLHATQQAIAAFASAAAHVDPLIARAAAPIGDELSERELRAVRLLDSLAYGANGYAALAFPSVDSALATHDAAVVGQAITKATELIAQAAALLSSK